MRVLFNNMKIGARLGLGFGVVVLLAVLLGAVCLNELAKMGTQWNRFEQVTLAKKNAVNLGNLSLGNGIHHFKNYILRGREYDKAFLKDMEEIDRASAAYHAAGSISQEELTLLDEMKKGTDRYRDDMAKLVEMRGKSAAITDMDGAIKGADKVISGAFAKLLEANERDTLAASKAMAQAWDRAFALILSTGAAVVLLGAGLAIWLTRGITRPLTEAVETANMVARGDLSFRIGNTSQDETGQLLRAMAVAQQSLQTLVADAGLLSQAADVGKLTTRADATKHQGDYRKIVDGVNATLNRLVGFLDLMPAPAMVVDKEFNVLYLNELGAKVGNKTPAQVIGTKCYDHFRTSDCKTDKCACGRAMGSGQVAGSETDAHPGTLNLDIAYTGMPLRNPEGNVVGAFEFVIDQTAVKQAARVSRKVTDYQKAETAKVVDGISKLAVGDVNISLVTAAADNDTAVVKETYDTIGEAVNTCVGTIKALIGDTNMLSRAALEGKLDVRADASKHQGEFRTLVQGVNEIVANIAEPLKVTSGYVDQIAKGVIPAIITTDYKGEYGVIKNNLNTLVKMMSDLLAQTDIIIKAAANGELDERANADMFQGGWKQLVAGVNKTLDGVILPVNEAVAVLTEMEKGDLTREVKGDYKGQLKDFKDTVNNCVDKLAETMRDVRGAADALSSASEQVSATAQSLSQGSSEQAASVEETSASIEQMSASISQNTENAKVTDGIASRASKEATDGGEAVKSTVTAMKQIADKIGIIDDIAYQTNLLAL
ncbi:MAG: HAMP domain-containing protein, partial [Sulfuricella sp.]